MTEGSAVGTPPPRRRTPRWILALLVVSLLFNGIVLGAVISGRWIFHVGSPWLGASVSGHLVGFAVTLPVERRREIWRATAGDRERMRPLRKAIRSAREEARAALLAQPFDPERFKAAQARLFEAEQNGRRAAQNLIYEIAVRLSPEERAAFARWEQRDGKHRSRFWRRMKESEQEAERVFDNAEPPSPPGRR